MTLNAIISRLILIMVAIVILVGCGESSNKVAQQHANELVRATQSAGLALGLTPQIAVSLYGKNAHAICGPLKDDEVNLVTLSRIQLWGTPSDKTDDLIAYDKLVVQTYCPDQLEEFEELLNDLNQ